MLIELRIRDLAIIRQVTLPLAPAFNVLSGETGAGKSIIVGALTVLLGDRASTDTCLESGADRQCHTSLGAWVHLNRQFQPDRDRKIHASSEYKHRE